MSTHKNFDKICAVVLVVVLLLTGVCMAFGGKADGGNSAPPDLPSGNSDGTLPDKPDSKGGGRDKAPNSNGENGAAPNGRDGAPTGSALSTSALILSAASALVLILGLLAALLYKRRK